MHGSTTFFCSVLLALVGTAGLPSTVRAYRTALSAEGVDGQQPPAWRQDFAFKISTAQPLSLAFTSVEGAFHEARSAWRGCGAPIVSYAGASVHSGVLGDGINTIEWVHTGWTELGLAPDAMATTDVNLVRQPDGRWDITEADIYINAQHFEWVAGTPAAGSSARSLTAVLTHELGHALGLLHPCEPEAEGDAPACSSEHASVAMYPLYDGRTVLTLAADDRAGLCAVYPCVAPACDTSCTTGSCPGDRPRCASDFECGAGHCVDTVCVAQPLFDLCADDAECGVGHCGEQGYCTVGCSSSCGLQAACVAGQCAPLRSVFGEDCEFSGNCVSDVCVEYDGVAQCSRLCSDALACPAGYSCDHLTGVNVCVPLHQASCSAGLGVPRRGWSVWSMWAVSLFVALMARRRSSWLRGKL